MEPSGLAVVGAVTGDDPVHDSSKDAGIDMSASRSSGVGAASQQHRRGPYAWTWDVRS